MDKAQVMHVVAKADNSVHASVALIATKEALASTSIRVTTEIISLTSNNLSYARGGDFLHWWDAYPVPSTAPAPYNDSKSWGIVPAWGYASVLESTTAIKPGTVIWGFWPTSSGSTDLKIEQSILGGQWTEVSEHRSKLMTIYNQYSIVPDFPSMSSLSESQLKQTAWEVLFRPTWSSGYLLSQYNFTPSPSTQPPVHPLGTEKSWTASDADLSNAVLVSLSSSSKTARSFEWHLSQRAKHSGPLGLLKVTSAPSDDVKGSIMIHTTTYGNIAAADTLEWIAHLEPSKVVILDFGGRGNSLYEFIDSLRGDLALATLELVVVQIGSEQKVYTKEEMLSDQENLVERGKVQFNSSGVRDAVIARTSAEDFAESVKPVWKEWVKESRALIQDMELKIGKGVKGSDGIEGGWGILCDGKVPPTEGLIYTF